MCACACACVYARVHVHARVSVCVRPTSPSHRPRLLCSPSPRHRWLRIRSAASQRSTAAASALPTQHSTPRGPGSCSGQWSVGLGVGGGAQEHMREPLGRTGPTSRAHEHNPSRQPLPLLPPPPLHCIRLAVQGQEPDAKAKARFERSLEAAKTLQPLEDALSTGENSSGAAHKPR